MQYMYRVGNEGEGRTHYSGQLISGNVLDAELAIGDYEPQISIQIWKRAMDNARIELIAPTGERLVISERNAGLCIITLRICVSYQRHMDRDHSIWVKRYMQP